MNRALLVDHDPDRRARFEQRLLDRGCLVTLAASAAEAEKRMAGGALGAVVLRVPLAGQESLETFSALHEVSPRLPIILVTARGSTEEAIRATTLGAFDYLLEPFTDDELVKVVERAIEAGRLTGLEVQLDHEDGVPASGDALIGRSRSMQEIYKAIGSVALTDSTVLVRGESGTGKELVARAVYQHSKRADRPFVVVNCVAIPGNPSRE